MREGPCHGVWRYGKRRRGGQGEGGGEAAMYITVACGMFGITLTLIHMQDAGHGISEGKCGVTMRCVDNRIGGPGMPEPPHDVLAGPSVGK